MSKRVLCKFHIHRACLKGEHCEFSHDLKDEPNNICTYYQKGLCSYGSRCRYDHVKVSRPKAAASSSSAVPLVPPTRTTPNRNIILPAASAVVPASPRAPHYSREPTWNLESLDEGLLDNGFVMEPRNLRAAADLPICSFAAAGNCPHGEKCPHLHGDLCSTCGKHCLHPFRPQERDEHIRACEQRKKHDESLKCSEEIECCVCLDRVLSKPTEAERKFGLLSECDHSFCISCIRNWRSSSPTSGFDPNTSFRACPICRKTSYFVIPSRVWYSNPEEKQEIVDNYKSKLSSINCKHFNFGNGSCPFGTSCFYKHTVKPGSYVWKNGRPPPRLPSRMRRARRSNDMEMHSVLDHILVTLFTRDLLDDYNDYDDYDDFTVQEPSEDDIEAALFLMGYYDSSDEENDVF